MTTARPGTVLIVEDDLDLCDVYSTILEEEGYRVVVAQNGRDALAWLGDPANRPCLIILDLMMPVMNGWQFRVEQLRDRRLSAIPVVISSAHANLREKAESIGAAGTLAKPTSLDQLFEVVERFCDRRSSEAARR